MTKTTNTNKTPVATPEDTTVPLTETPQATPQADQGPAVVATVSTEEFLKAAPELRPGQVNVVQGVERMVAPAHVQTEPLTTVEVSPGIIVKSY